MAKKWTEDELEYLEHYIRNHEGTPHEEVAEFLGRSLSAVYNKARKLRLERNIPTGFKKKFSESEIEYIKNNYRQGEPTLRMSRHLKRSRQSIHSIVNKLGLSKRKYVKDCDAEIRAFAEKGLWNREIAKRVGFHEITVMKYMKTNSIKCQKAPKAVMQRGFKRMEIKKENKQYESNWNRKES